MKKTFIYLFVAVSVCSILFPLASCKKGKGDPFFSFRSRKARVSGEWVVKKLTSEDETVITQNGVFKYYSTSDYDGTSLIYVLKDPAGVITRTIYETEMTYTFEKSGDWKSQTTRKNTVKDSVYIYVNGSSYFYARNRNFEIIKAVAGKWDFLSGVDGKSKEKIYLKVVTSLETTNVSNSYTAIDAGAPAKANDVEKTEVQEDIDSGNNVWTLTTLSNKKMDVEQKVDSHISEKYNGVSSDQEKVVTESTSMELEAK